MFFPGLACDFLAFLLFGILPLEAPLLLLHLTNICCTVHLPSQVKLEDAMQHVAQCFPEIVFSRLQSTPVVATTTTLFAVYNLHALICMGKQSCLFFRM